ncbi:MAG: hypothetical protein IPM06_19050 [Rhizobiales bacterium]|nr:hypothetical protein [Hyphomicrobiales bacterium]
MAGFTYRNELTRLEVDFDEAVEKPAGRIVLTFRITYLTAAGSPGTRIQGDRNGSHHQMGERGRIGSIGSRRHQDHHRNHQNTTGVVSSTAHGCSMAIIADPGAGMYQVNYRVFRVSAVATDSFSLEGEDTTNYGTFVSGTAQKITFGTSLATLTSINASGGDFDFIDTTTIHDNIKTQVPGPPNPSNYTSRLVLGPVRRRPGRLKSASDSQAQRAILFSLANGQKFTFTPTSAARCRPPARRRI